MKRRKLIRFLFHFVFLVLTLAWVYPLIWTVSSSLKTNREMFSGSVKLFPDKFEWSFLLPSNWGQLEEILQFDNYSRAWYIANFSQYFINTLLFTFAVVIIVIALCALTGYVLGRYDFLGKFLIMGAIIATMFIPAGYTIIPLWQLINALGLGKSMAGLILAEAGGTHVLYILLFTAYFSRIPKELEEASQIDGAGFVRTFFTIMLPLAKPVIATTFILQFINSWNSFFVPLVFTIHRPDLRTLGVGMYSFVEDNSSDLAAMAAGATISFIPIVVIFLIFQKYFVDGIAGSAKG
ncbi:raffinose/stachyose/melibiose transport system permease protein [Bacillus niacini]|uniref:Raffinose/stachyose/melibiose transport system permease protein n=1 Tax=Neobacillus niacini TaxID=86668 RepID=A0A852T6J5_9BACI|nr:carbohydrate ABC transporter permease [Neobacillus niacini]NYE03437.1 raffinose/stachyose/melibiose transport system permease protein [Neobacillus niacini]